MKSRLNLIIMLGAIIPAILMILPGCSNEVNSGQVSSPKVSPSVGPGQATVDPAGAAVSASPINPTGPLEESIVQVGESEDNPEALGVAVGDGSQILTVIDYESNNPGELEVTWPGHGSYTASFQATDSRTGATLLKLENAKLPPAKTGDAKVLSLPRKIYLYGDGLTPERLLPYRFHSIQSRQTYHLRHLMWHCPAAYLTRDFGEIIREQ